MSSEFCSICQSKRRSRALCNCCREYLCLEHLKEHEDIVEQQFDPLIDRINQLVDHFEHRNLDELLHEHRHQLNLWRQKSIESIEKFYQNKFKEIDEFYSQRFDDLSRKTKEIRNQIGQISQNHNGTNEQIQTLTQSIDEIERKRKNLEENSLKIHFRPLEIDLTLIEMNSNEANLLNLSPVVQTIDFLSAIDLHPVASNSSSILIFDHFQLFLFDHNLTLVNNSNIYDEIFVRDVCWSSKLNRFLILSDKNLFLLNEKTMSIEKCSTIETPRNGHWHRLTTSNDRLYLTAYRWATRIYRFIYSANQIQLDRSLQIVCFTTKDESIDSFLHNQQSCIAMIITNRSQNQKRFELRLDEDFNIIWSIELDPCLISSRPIDLTLFNENQWIIIDSNRSQMILISSNGSIETTFDYSSFDGIQQVLQIQKNLLLVLNNRSANLHQLL